MLCGLIILAVLSVSSGQNCGDDLEGPGGWFTTPRYPWRYPRNALCEWDITVKEGNKIQLEFVDFLLEKAAPIFGCILRDYVIIEDGVTKYGPFCSAHTPPKITSAGNRLKVTFRSDDSLEKRGFNATYQEIDVTPPGPTTRMPPGTTCVTEALGDKGFVTSPNYPKPYPGNADCSIFITLESNDARVALKFLELDIEDGEDCKSDAVTVHDGPNGNFPVLGKFCGKNPALDPITASGKEVYIRFTSNDGISGRGFNISYEVASCEEAGGRCAKSCGNGKMNGTFPCEEGMVCCKKGLFPGECGKRFTDSASETPHIVGGREAKPNSWPWMVSLQMPETNFHFCGAVLLSDTWVVSAAHCLYDYESVSVVLGEHNREEKSGDEVRIESAKIILHGEFENLSPWPNDIALIKLSRKAPIGPKIYPACFPTEEDMPLETDEDCFITGWGDTKDTGDRTLLQELKIKAISNEMCQGSWGDRIKDTNVCLGDGSAGSCQGDSGGPFVCKKEGHWVLGGVTSWGIRGCRTVGYPPVYTRVSKYVDWVQDKILDFS